MNSLEYMPIGLSLDGRRVVLIGGGKVAAQKLRTLIRFSAKIFVHARSVCEEIRLMNVSWTEEEYKAELIDGAFLVFVCTSDRELNERVMRDANEMAVLVNVADAPSQCDFVSPAVWFKGTMSVAVLSDGKNAKRSVEWRNAIREWGENDPALREG